MENNEFPFGPKSSLDVEFSSFKDPSAKVFYKEGKIYRLFSENYLPTYRKFMDSGLYQALLDKNLIIPHKEVSKNTISPETVFITYPWEWCFSEFKDAALATLQIQKTALEFGMVLKDATPFNIQFFNNKPVLIDTSSFEEFKGAPWSAYRQFAENFLAPLALISYTDLNLSGLLLSNINGIPLDLASKLLPKKTKFNLNLLAHIHIHSKMQNKYSGNNKKVDAKITKNGLLGIIENLETTVSNLTLSKYKTEWEEYYSNTNYTKDSFMEKENIVKAFGEKVSPKTVWDFGANTGIFSRIFSANGAKTLSFDIDKLAVEKNYLTAKENNEKNILPLVFDLVNPSPALGFDNRERKTLKERAKNIDLVLALALIHHLKITYNVPFCYAAKYFSEISNHLIIEFVDKEDSKIQTMLLNREDIFSDYTKKDFEEAFGKFYNILDSKPISNTKRTLYLMEKRNG